MPFEKTITWDADQIRCLRMCGYRVSQAKMAGSLSVHTWKSLESGRTTASLDTVRVLDEFAAEIDWKPSKCRKFCERTIERRVELQKKGRVPREWTRI